MPSTREATDFFVEKKMLFMPGKACLLYTSFAGAMTNTVFVMGSIYFLLAKEYAAAKSVAIDAVWGLVLLSLIHI